jgi:GrpB-like predicted nucleotidyltransferase (UPF0157 family)
MLSRIALAVAALVVGGWLAFTLRAFSLEDEARALIPAPPGKPAPGAVDRMEHLLRDAAKANPDIRPDFQRGYLLAIAGEHERSAAVFRDVLRREPENGRAAAALYVELRRFDPAAAAEVRTRLERLAPPVDGG